MDYTNFYGPTTVDPISFYSGITPDVAGVDTYFPVGSSDLSSYYGPTTNVDLAGLYSGQVLPDFSGTDFLSGYQTPGFWDQLTSGNLTGALSSAYTDLGGLKGLANLGLGGLSAYYTLKAKDKENALAEQRLNAEIGFRQAEQNQDLARTDAMMNLLNQRGRVALDPRRYAEIVASGQIPADLLATQQRVDVGAPAKFASGGLGLLRGGTSGQADKINARLSDGEYVMDADVVAALGDGNTEAGARRLDEMREQVRRHKRSAGAKNIPPPAKSPLEYLKKGR